GTDVFDVDLTGDDLVSESDDHCGDEREAVFALVRDQNTKVLALVAFVGLHRGLRLHPAGILRNPGRTDGDGLWWVSSAPSLGGPQQSRLHHFGRRQVSTPTVATH